MNISGSNVSFSLDGLSASDLAHFIRLTQHRSRELSKMAENTTAFQHILRPCAARWRAAADEAKRLQRAIKETARFDRLPPNCPERRIAEHANGVGPI